MNIVNYIAKNRKLKLEEYDDFGKLINVRDFPKEDIVNFIVYQIDQRRILSIARKEDLNMFSKEELNLVNEIIIECNEFYCFTNNESKDLREILDQTDIDVLKGALKLMVPLYWGDHIFNNNKKYYDDFTLKEMINFIKSRDGIYYTIDEYGERDYDFINKPTKEEAFQHKNNFNARIVFLDFNDWKEYRINENEL